MIDTTTNQHKVSGCGPFAEWELDELKNDPKKAQRWEQEAERVAKLATVTVCSDTLAKVRWSSVTVLANPPVTDAQCDFDRYTYNQSGPDASGRVHPRGFDQVSPWRAGSAYGTRDRGSIGGTARGRIIRRAATIALETALRERPWIVLEGAAAAAKARYESALYKLNEARAAFEVAETELSVLYGLLYGLGRDLAARDDFIATARPADVLEPRQRPQHRKAG